MRESWIRRKIQSSRKGSELGRGNPEKRSRAVLDWNPRLRPGQAFEGGCPYTSKPTHCAVWWAENEPVVRRWEPAETL